MPQNTDLSLSSYPVKLDEIPYIDHPEIKINKHESTQMPFRYVRDGKGDAIMPSVYRIIFSG